MSSISTLLSRIPPSVLYAIMCKVGLSQSDLERCEFTFGPLPPRTPGALGTHTDLTAERKGKEQYAIQLDERQMQWTPSRPWTKNIFYNVLIHELQHLKQSLTGYLAPTADTTLFVWQGRPHETVSDGNFKAYRELPWEVDADAVSRRIVDELVAEGLIAHLTDENGRRPGA